MKIYLKDGNTYWQDEPFIGADAECEVSPIQEEILRNGGTADYRGGQLVVTPKAPEIAETTNTGLTKLEFMQRFTDEELGTIYTIAKTNVAVEIWLAKFNATTPDELGYSVYLDDPATVASIHGLEMAGLLAAGRAVEILS